MKDLAVYPALTTKAPIEKYVDIIRDTYIYPLYIWHMNNRHIQVDD